MAITKKGTLTVTSGGTAQNLNLGFTPSFFRMVNKTKLAATTNGVVIAEWWDDMANGTANIWTTSAGDGTNKITQISSNGVTPFQSSDSTLWTPTQKAISIATTGITNAAAALVTTASAHGFTSSDIGVTTVTFSGVKGMTQINTLRGVIQSVPSATTFTVNINTSNFSAFSQSGHPYVNVITGIPPSETVGFQVFNTPQSNAGFIGLTLGTSLMVTTNDVWEYLAILDAPFTSA